MGVRLMVEVLDHYHGPDAKKLWLLAFAEAANDGTRVGWPGRPLLAHRTGRSPVRASNIATELVTDGVIKRVGGGGRHRGEARFCLLPLAVDGAPQGSAWANPEKTDGQSQGSAWANPKPEVKGSESGCQGSAESPLPAKTSDNPQNPHTPLTPAASRQGQPCPRHAKTLGRPHANCKACGTSPRARQSAAKAETAQFVERARRQPPCQHGQPGGDQIHPASGQPLCPLCRTRGRPPS